MTRKKLLVVAAVLVLVLSTAGIAGAVTNGQPDDGAHQWAVPNSVLNSSAAPTTTILVPGSGPRANSAKPSTTSLTSTLRRV